MKVWLPYVIGGSGTDTFTASFASHLEAAGHLAIPQPFPHWMQYVPDLLKVVREPVDADVTLTNTWNGFAFKRRDLPMVTLEHLCVHDPEYAPMRTRFQSLFHNTLVRWFETRTFAEADRVVAVSRATKNAVMQSFQGVEPIVIPNGVDTDFFAPDPESAPSLRTDGPFRLLFIGNLTKRKGADLLGEIMRGLGPDFVLSYTSGLRERALLDAENSIPLGSLDRERVRAAYRTADAFVFPTRLEGLPIAVLEAMACGLPVIGSDRSSMPEAVAHGTTGLLCPLDAEAFIEAIVRLANDSDLRSAMSIAARERVVREFSMRLTAERYLELFAEVSNRAL